eukprot:g4083.t1
MKKHPNDSIPRNPYLTADQHGRLFQPDFGLRPEDVVALSASRAEEEDVGQFESRRFEPRVRGGQLEEDENAVVEVEEQQHLYSEYRPSKATAKGAGEAKSKYTNEEHDEDDSNKVDENTNKNEGQEEERELAAGAPGGSSGDEDFYGMLDDEPNVVPAVQLEEADVEKEKSKSKLLHWQRIARVELKAHLQMMKIFNRREEDDKVWNVEPAQGQRNVSAPLVPGSSRPPPGCVANGRKARKGRREFSKKEDLLMVLHALEEYSTGGVRESEFKHWEDVNKKRCKELAENEKEKEQRGEMRRHKLNALQVGFYLWFLEDFEGGLPSRTGASYDPADPFAFLKVEQEVGAGGHHEVLGLDGGGLREQAAAEGAKTAAVNLPVPILLEADPGKHPLGRCLNSGTQEKLANLFARPTDSLKGRWRNLGAKPCGKSSVVLEKNEKSRKFELVEWVLRHGGPGWYRLNCMELEIPPGADEADGVGGEDEAGNYVTNNRKNKNNLEQLWDLDLDQEGWGIEDEASPSGAAASSASGIPPLQVDDEEVMAAAEEPFFQDEGLSGGQELGAEMDAEPFLQDEGLSGGQELGAEMDAEMRQMLEQD